MKFKRVTDYVINLADFKNALNLI